MSGSSEVNSWFEWTQIIIPIFCWLFGIICGRYYERKKDYQTKRNNSILAAVLIDGIIKEVEYGYQILLKLKRDSDPSKLEDDSGISYVVPPSTAITVDYNKTGTLDSSSVRQQLLPSKTWEGMNTISKEELLRIIDVSNGKPINGFPIIEIKRKLSDYFTIIVRQVNDAIESQKPLSSFFDTEHRFDEATKGVLKMLTQVRELLMADVKTPHPWFH